MKTINLTFLLLFFFSCLHSFSQSGPWAKYDQELKDGALYREASGGNLEEVKSIIQGGGNIHYASAQQKFTILMAAAGSGKIEVVRYLLSLGADPAAKDWWNQTAIDKARSVGAKDIVQLLQQALNTKEPKPETKPKEEEKPREESNPKENTQPPVAKRPETPPTITTKGFASWPLFGTYKVGDTVIYWTPVGWRRGVVKELGVAKATGRISVDFSERKYKVDPDAYALNDDWYEWTTVVKTERQPFWTSWFVGTWQIGEVQAHHNEVKDRTETDRYYYMGATETLQVAANGTYRWKLMNGTVKTGKWIAASGEPGIVLKKAYRDFDWTLRNNTSIHDLQIRNLDMIKLHPSAMVGSINGKRKATL